MDNRLGGLEEQFTINASEVNQNVFKRSLFRTTKKNNYATNKTDVFHIDDVCI